MIDGKEGKGLAIDIPAARPSHLLAYLQGPGFKVLRGERVAVNEHAPRDDHALDLRCACDIILNFAPQHGTK